jgi:hypothetical protein
MPTFLSKNDKRRSGFGSCMAVAIMMGPSLAYGSPACMTQSEARAKLVLAHKRQCPRLPHDPHKRQSSVSRSKRSAAHCWATPHQRQCPRHPHDPHKRQCPRLPHDPHKWQCPRLRHDPHPRQCPRLRHDPHPRQCPCLPFNPYRRQKDQDRNVDICRVSKDPVRRGHMAGPSPTSDSTAKRSSTTWSSSTHDWSD